MQLRFSSTRLATWRACALHFRRRYRDRDPEDPGGPWTRSGSMFHRVVAELGQARVDQLDPWAGAPPEGATWHPTPAALLDAISRDPERNPVVRLDATQLLLAFRPWLDFGPTMAVEHQWKVEILPGVWATGILDRVGLLLGGAVVRVIDYKTGGQVPTARQLRADLQVGLYLVAARELYPEAHLYGVWWYARSEIPMKVAWTHELDTFWRTEAIHLFRASEEATEFPASPGPACGRCGYRSTCEPYRAWFEAGPPARVAMAELDGVEGDELMEIEARQVAAERVQVHAWIREAERRKSELDELLIPWLQVNERRWDVEGGRLYLKASTPSVRWPRPELTLALLAKLCKTSLEEVKARTLALSTHRIRAFLEAKGLTGRKLGAVMDELYQTAAYSRSSHVEFRAGGKEAPQ